MISQIRSRGTGGGNDDFVELYNATNFAVTLDANWKLEARSTTAGSYGVRWTGAGGVIPAYGHYLLGGTSYAQSPSADGNLSSGISDASSVRLVHSGSTVDAICFYFDATTQAAYDATFTCEGTTVSNLPHDNSASAASNVDISLERKPGGLGGHCTDSDDNAADFKTANPSDPRNSASPPVP